MSLSVCFLTTTKYARPVRLVQVDTTRQPLSVSTYLKAAVLLSVLLGLLKFLWNRIMRLLPGDFRSFSGFFLSFLLAFEILECSTMIISWHETLYNWIQQADMLSDTWRISVLFPTMKTTYGKAFYYCVMKTTYVLTWVHKSDPTGRWRNKKLTGRWRDFG